MSPALDLHDMEHTLLASVFGQTVGQEPAIPGGIEPVERGSTGRIQQVRIDRNAILTIDSLPPVQNGLILVPLPPEVEVAAAHRRRDAKHADGKQLRQPPA